MKFTQFLKKTGYIFTINFLRVILIFFIILLFIFVRSFFIGEYKYEDTMFFLFCIISACCIYIALIKVRKSFLNRFPSEKTVVDIQESPETIDLEIRCKSCGCEYTEPFYESYLCYDCRTEFSGRKIPGTVKIFSGVILMISAFSYCNVLERVDDKISYERGKRYIEEKNYTESEKYLSKIAEKFPEESHLQGRLFIAQVYMNRYEEAEKTYKKIEGKQLYSKELANEIETAAELLAKEIR